MFVTEINKIFSKNGKIQTQSKGAMPREGNEYE